MNCPHLRNAKQAGTIAYSGGSELTMKEQEAQTGLFIRISSIMI